MTKVCEIDIVAGMQHDLDRGRNATLRMWKKRVTQIDRVLNSMSGMIGALQGTAQDSLPQLEEIEQLSLPRGAHDG